jgi:hypothetical protein
MTGAVTIRPAQAELLELAAAMRPDWERDRLAGALASAAHNGWPWPRAFLAACRLLADPDALPRDLLAEIADPLHREGRPLSAEENARHAAEARARLAESTYADGVGWGGGT